MKSKSLLLPLIAVLGLSMIALVLYSRRYRVETPPPRDLPPTLPAPPPVAPPPPPLTGGRSTHPDPLLKKWQTSIVQRDSQGVLAAQSAFLEREGEYREPLVTMAKEDPDARIRAFSVAVLGRMRTPPPEQFFIDRLADSGDHPRTSALEALRKLGTAACLPAVEGLASSAAEGVRAAATETAKAVRSR